MFKVAQQLTDDLHMSAADLDEAITDWMKKKHTVHGLKRVSFFGRELDPDTQLLYVEEARITTFTVVEYEL